MISEMIFNQQNGDVTKAYYARRCERGRAMRMPTLGSLFAGIGGIDLGFERAGFKTAWQVEIDPYCRRVLARHFPDAERFEDVRNVGAGNLRRVDVIAGGFPCQDISLAGKGAGIDGERSGLVFEFIRIIGELRPSFVLMENVAALFTRGIDRVLGGLAAIGYDAEWKIISASDVGARHIRRRVWILAYPQTPEVQPRPSEVQEGTWPHETERSGNIREDVAHAIREGLAERILQRSVSADASRADASRADAREAAFLGRDVSNTAGRGAERSGSQRYEWRLQNEAVRGFRHSYDWQTEPDVGRVANGVPARVDRLRALGNAVVPQIPELIARQIMLALR